MRAILVLVVFLLGCSTQNANFESNVQEPNDDLMQFAKANCFFWYFKKKGYEVSDIGAISGGIVEMGTYSADTYQNVALLVKSYFPAIQTKNDIDVDLLKCFKIEGDKNFIQSLDRLR